MTSTPPPETQPRIEPLIEAIGQDGFREWYRSRQIKQHMRAGQPWRHTPASVTPPDRHAPNRLLQCHRKTYYKTQNAPKEDPQPEGLFWAGTRIEEDIVMPFLEDVVTEKVAPPAYVQNSMWVDYKIDTEAGEIQVRGETDPVICTRDGDPLLPTEVKTKESLDRRDGDDPTPAAHHRAQLHAYLYGLNQTVEYPVRTGLIIYVDRQHHEFRAVPVEFDLGFWEETVQAWAAAQTEYRLEDELPPATPEQGWECGYCSYRRRCGQSDGPHEDSPAEGFLPLTRYPRRQVQAALRAEGGAEALTPTLAFQYPELAEEFRVADWKCPACSERHTWDDPEWSGDPGDPPVCPNCVDNEWLAPLRGPAPSSRHPEKQS